jgi:hypothetical protein
VRFEIHGSNAPSVLNDVGKSCHDLSSGLRKSPYLPKYVLGITFGSQADRRRPEIFETSAQFLRRPAELFI